MGYLENLKRIAKKSSIARALWKTLNNFRIEIVNFILKKKLLLNYRNSNDNEINEIISFLKRNKLYLYNYDWYLDSMKADVRINFDENWKSIYFNHNGQKVYYRRFYDVEGAIYNYKLMISEQDKRCPHCYNNYISENEMYDVIIDAGTAEGMFALNHLGKSKCMILVEGDKLWVEALKLTFADQIKDKKVIIVNKYLSDRNDGEYITLDKIMSSYIGNAKNVLIKMDIEGYEEKALKGGKNLIANVKNIKIIACSYHHQDAERQIAGILNKYKFRTRHSKGYMYFFPAYEKGLFHEERNHKIIPLLRRALVVGVKN